MYKTVMGIDTNPRMAVAIAIHRVVSGTVHSRGITTHKGRYLSPEEVCELVPGLTKATLAQRRYRGLAPKFLKPSPRLVLYRENDVIAWIEGSEQSGTVDGHSGPR